MADKVQLNVWLEPEMRDQLRALAEERESSISELVRQGVSTLVPREPSSLERWQRSIDETIELDGRLVSEHGIRLDDLDRRLSKLEEMAHGGF